MQQQQALICRNRPVCPLIGATLLFLCLLPAMPCAARNNPEPEVEAMCMLEEHNAVRAGAGVPELRWSGALARQAAGWARELKKTGCAMKHSPASFGENLYWAGARKTGTKSKSKGAWKWSLAPQPITEKEVVAGWAAEQPWYSQATNTCDAPPGKTCGHYTQMVWKTTREIGCAKAICDDSSQVWVCNYAPAGNIAGQRPY